MRFKPGWELAWEMYQEAERNGIPHRWVTGDEEYGKVPELADRLHAAGAWYVFEVPCSTRVWEDPPRFREPRGRRGRSGRGEARPHLVGGSRVRSVPVAQIAAKLRDRDWVESVVRQGEKGPIRVQATRWQVWLSRDGIPSRPAWLLITRPVSPPDETQYFLAEATWRVSMSEMLRAAYGRWPIEQCFRQGKQPPGMDPYETRSWAGWHHPVTMVLLAHPFLVLQRLKRGKKSGRAGAHRRGGRPGATRASAAA